MLHNGKLIKYEGADRVKLDIRFKPGMRGCRSHPDPWHGIGHHWTGGEGSPDTLYRVLAADGNSVHFANPPTGPLVQFADLNTQCSHMGGANPRFAGMETTCRGYASKADLEAARKLDPTLRARDELDWSVQRDVYTDLIAGRSVNMAAFNPSQIENAVWASNALAATFDFPRLILFLEATKERMDRPTPLGDRTLGDIAVTHNGKLYVPDFETRDLRKKKPGVMATHRGALAHFQCHPNKHDPGTGILYRLWADGWNPAQKTIEI